MEGSLAVTGRLSTSHVVYGGDPSGAGMDVPGPNSKGDYRHKRHQPVRDPVEGSGGADKSLPTRQPAYARRPPQVQGRKRDGGGYNGVKNPPGALQHRLRPLLLVLLDLRKAYDTVDQERLLITMEGYGAGPHMCGLLESLWDC